LDLTELNGIPNTTDAEYQPTAFTEPASPARSPAEEKVSVSVGTAGGKIAPDWRLRRPAVQIRYSTIDTSFSKGEKKEVTNISTSLSKDSRPKKPTFEDFTLNRAISRRPTEKDYSYGCKTVKETSCRDFSLNKNTDPKPPTNIDYKLSSGRVKPVTRYDYRYNWQPTKPASRYNYSYYRGYKLPSTSYDYSYNTKQSQPPSSLCYCFKQDLDVVKSPTEVDHSYDKSTEKKPTTEKSSSLAPLDQEPKQPSHVDHSFAGDKPKKNVSRINTAGDKKQPTEIDTRAKSLVSQGQGVDMKQDVEHTISIMKEYMDKIEKVAAENQEKENEMMEEMKVEREKEVARLIAKYGSKSQAGLTSEQERRKVIGDLLLTYGKQNKNKSQYLNLDTGLTLPAQTLNQSRRIITPSPRRETEVQLEDTGDSDQFILRSRRPRPTSLRLILNE